MMDSTNNNNSNNNNNSSSSGHGTGYVRPELSVSQSNSTMTREDEDSATAKHHRYSSFDPTQLPPDAYYADIMAGTTAKNPVLDTSPLTPSEIATLRVLLQRNNNDLQSLAAGTALLSLDSDYPEFGESTHAWAVFAGDPRKRAGIGERMVGTIIIVFQLFAYRLFATEAIADFQKGVVPVTISHRDCLAATQQQQQDGGDDHQAALNGNFQCEAEFTNTIDAFVAFFMLSIFLTPDMLQACRVIQDAPWGVPMIFACLAGIEVVSAYLAASIAVSYHLFIGEITDAVEVGVGLLFIRELSQQTYRGIRYGKTKQFRNFFLVLALLVTLGMIMDPLTAKIFAGYIQ